VDVSDPALPAPLPGPAIRASALALRGDRLYVGTRSAVLEIYDISDAADPVRVGSTSLRPGSTRPTDLDLDGSRLYVTTQFGIEIFDVSVDSAPTRIGVIEGRPFVFESTPYGNLLFSSAQLGFLVTDVSDPAAPVVAGPFGSSTLQAEIEVVADRLFVGSVPMAFDISEPLAPRLLGGSGYGSQIETSGGVVYLTGTSIGGLYAVDFGPEYAPTLEVKIDISPLDPRNRVVITRPGLLMLGLFGSPALDVRDVDPGSLAFGPLGAPAIRALPLRLDRDAHKDLLSIHRIAEAGIAIGDTEACLSGATWDGRRFRGCDAIQPLAGCGDGYALALLIPLLVPLRRAIRRRPVQGS